MSELLDILALHESIAKHTAKCALATIINTEGSSYRSPGARSLIVDDGTFRGGLSAGCLEKDIACRLDSNNSPFIVDYDLSTEDDVRGFPFGCGGKVRILVEPLPNQGALQAVQWLSELNEPAVLLTVVAVQDADQGAEATSPNVGARFGKSASGSNIFRAGLNELPELIEMVIESKKSLLKIVAVDELSLTVFAEYIEPAIKLTILGDDEDARALESLANTVGLTVQRISKNEIREDRVWLSKVHSQPSPFVVVMTHDLNLDAKVLQNLIVSRPAYLGVMGPKSRTTKILLSINVEPQTVFHRPEFYAPIGLNMAAETPNEIALSILAEIQTVARRVQPAHLRDLNGAIHARADSQATLNVQNQTTLEDKQVLGTTFRG